jgi:hypothetical protein
MIAVNKDNGVMAEKLIQKDNILIAGIRASVETILKSKPDRLPEPPEEYSPNARGFYPWQCAYCAYWGKCRTNAEYVLVGKSNKLKERKNA